MPFGNKSRYVRSYEFGCLDPIENKDKAIEVMFQRVKLWNSLVELDHKYCDKKEKLIAPYITVPNDKEHSSEYKEQRRQAFKVESVKSTLAEYQKQEYEESKPLYQNSGLYWGNYLDVTTSWNKAKGKSEGVKFHSSRDGGKVHVQWPTGMPVSQVFDHSSNVLRLNPVSPHAYSDPQRCNRRELQRSTVSIRIASDENRQPIWLTLPCVLHRPLPDGLIRSADVLRKRIATHWRWKLIIVVETQPDIKKPSNKGSIAIDIGWRKRPNGLRVCYWSDDSGNQGEELLSNYFITGMGRADSIESKRKLDFNKALDVLVKWKKEAKFLPEWFNERTKTLSLWKSMAKLASLVIFWRSNSFENDRDIFQIMEWWYEDDKHHYEYQNNLKDRLLRQRREQYRLFAARITQNYSKVIMKDLDLRSLVKRAKKGGKADELPEKARHQRFLAAPSELRMCIDNACKREGLEIEYKEPAYTTQMCCVCGSIDFDANPGKLNHTCPNCLKILGVKVKLDQDYNSTQNLINKN